MSQISHFQVYSQRENHVTNNTLLMLRHVYRVSPMRLEKTLQSFIEGDISVGPKFVQQQRETDSIPDALVSQDPFHLYVEAKPFITLDFDQVARHLQSIANKGHRPNTAIFLVICREPLLASQCQQLAAMCNKEQIRFATTTYADLIDSIVAACDGEVGLTDIIDDFRLFIGQQGLIPERHRWMVAMLCGTTWKENVEHRAYFEPASRNSKWSSASFLGLYHSKQISHVGKISASVICCVTNGEVRVVEMEFADAEPQRVSPEQLRSIKTITQACKQYFGDFAVEPFRYYLVDKFEKTDFQKASKGGLMGHRYFDLSDWNNGTVLNPDLTSDEVAKLLNRKSFDKNRE